MGKTEQRRWQDDEPFVAWLISMQYAYRDGSKIEPQTSYGVVLYMWEAWCASREDLAARIAAAATLSNTE